MEYININGKEYQFVIGYGKNNELRKSLNDLTQKIFGFSFERWYALRIKMMIADKFFYIAGIHEGL